MWPSGERPAEQSNEDSEGNTQEKRKPEERVPEKSELQGHPARAKMLREMLFLGLARQVLGAHAAVALGDQAVAKPGSRTCLSLHGIYVLEPLVPR